MSEAGGPKTLTGTSFLADKQSGEDASIVRIVAPRLVMELVRLFKSASMFSADHEQVRLSAQELVDWLSSQFVAYKEESFSLQLTENNVFFEGQLVKFEESQFSRSIILRATFLTYAINQITLKAGITAGEIVEMLKEVDAVRRGEKPTLEGFARPHLKLTAVGHKDLEQLAEHDERRAVIELYAGLVIKSATYFHQLKRNPDASARFIKRLVQKTTDAFETHRHVFVGLINMRLIAGQDFIHAVNTALYAMFIAHDIKLDRLDLVRVAMTAITQDIQRLAGLVSDEDAEIDVGRASHFKTNMTNVTMLSEMGAADLLSALRLVTSYERGFPVGKPLPEQWYREELRPHLLSRIIEIARHYDLLTQGMQGHERMSADLAMQAISEKMGRHYDPALTKLFINLIGVYPVGEAVRLSTGEDALVVRSPTVGERQRNKSVAHRPTVRLLDGSERLIDLSAEEHHAVRIVSIVKSTEETSSERPGAFFFF